MVDSGSYAELVVVDLIEHWRGGHDVRGNRRVMPAIERRARLLASAGYDPSTRRFTGPGGIGGNGGHDG